MLIRKIAQTYEVKLEDYSTMYSLCTGTGRCSVKEEVVKREVVIKSSDWLG